MAACQTLFAILDSEQEKTKVRGSLSGRKAISSLENVTLPTRVAKWPRCAISILDIPEGKTVALVGRSGSGKSTIASPITRFYDVDEGRSCWMATTCARTEADRCATRWRWFRKTMHLFNDTVANNIALCPYRRVQPRAD
ncbi:ATP-binding cassette domain-containing protein [Klebsiella pneumoniae subsp. pneumoniae]|nr:ATP-binding cassette domain-containing protein [Klebsiella pneumoniae subsp. pneumoniae]